MLRALLGEGDGTTKRAASINAARKAWEKIQAEPSLAAMGPMESPSREIPVQESANGSAQDSRPLETGQNDLGPIKEPIMEEPFSHGVGLESFETSSMVMNDPELPVSETVGTEGEAKGE